MYGCIYVCLYVTIINEESMNLKESKKKKEHMGRFGGQKGKQGLS